MDKSGNTPSQKPGQFTKILIKGFDLETSRDDKEPGPFADRFSRVLKIVLAERAGNFRWQCCASIVGELDLPYAIPPITAILFKDASRSSPQSRLERYWILISSFLFYSLESTQQIYLIHLSVGIQNIPKNIPENIPKNIPENILRTFPEHSQESS